MEEKIELGEVIENLRTQLSEVMERGSGSSLRFELREIEIEAQVVVERNLKGETGVSFWVFNASVSGERGQQTLHKVTLKLGPAGPGTNPRSLIKDDAEMEPRIAP